MCVSTASCLTCASLHLAKNCFLNLRRSTFSPSQREIACPTLASASRVAATWPANCSVASGGDGRQYSCNWKNSLRKSLSSWCCHFEMLLYCRTESLCSFKTGTCVAPFLVHGCEIGAAQCHAEVRNVARCRSRIKQSG